MAVTTPHIGQLRQTGSLQVNTPVQQGAGKKDSYATFLTCRGSLNKLRGQRILDSGEVVISSGWEWICRYQSAIADIDNKKAIRWQIDGRFFTVTDYEIIDQKHRYFRFILLENE
jgi:hypothetical protein